MGAVQSLRDRMPAMVDLLSRLVNSESPSASPDLVRSCLEVLAGAGTELLGSAPEWLEGDGRHHLLWRSNAPVRVLILMHLDTVWPVGTVDRWPFRVDGATATGPGVFDMKAGAVQGLFAAASLPDKRGVAILATSDEEIGSPSSRPLIETEARGARAVLVLEPSLDGALKVARKGVASYRVRVEGRAAHASAPELGINATVEAAARLLEAARLSDGALGTTVTPTTIAGGTVTNTVPGETVFSLDVRARTRAELDRVDEALRSIQAVSSGARITVEPSSEPRLPMEPSASASLFALAQATAAGLGLEPLRGVHAPGGSDGNLTAALGVPTLDGLGAVGAGMHAEGERVLLAAMPERAALVAGILEALLLPGRK